MLRLGQLHNRHIDQQGLGQRCEMFLGLPVSSDKMTDWHHEASPEFRSIPLLMRYTT